MAYWTTDCVGYSIRGTATFGVLVLTLWKNRCEWEFVPVEGNAFADRAGGVCHP